ncbi:uncharacterized protein PHACADRAFT_147744 [Phanerochaete carnosa HHB-10118-sp]|uniref:Protein kinase domain-containing protein n=1 Tax=Phanerochaete carnosa (strain HHB-10118-sp) TaxID=650164 RepID=K5UTQ1_PHACS|nr:uncharacterized protein PHACADRAFT_147744 [Phanerochaete carnosa HHB-10118-sp]EKM53311.1 hypothetical protein PHACADRAFT_147744 [Phanerochaete carnosa HHB-10118-sp]
MSAIDHRQTASVSQNHKAQLASAYNELGKELSSQKIRVIGNYTLGKAIGEGAYGKVRLGVHRLTGTRVAIKQIPKAMSASLTREIHHHRQLHHPHVTQLYEVIATENYIWLVTELCSGGELFDYLAEKGRLSEDETRMVFGQLCLAVAYIHEKGIIHRDLKLENVLLDEHCRVKLGDFGFTREFDRGTLLETFCGTTGYASPEMLQSQKYLGPEVDIWSLGVILYTLLTGMLPFDDDDDDVMRTKVIKGVFEDPEWLSDEARDLIKNILVVEPSKRLSIAHILSHSWFSPHQSLPSFPPILSGSGAAASRSASPTLISPASLEPQPVSASSEASDATFHSASSEFSPPTPSTPDDVAVGVVQDEDSALSRIASVSTLRYAVESLADKLPPVSSAQEVMSPEGELLVEAPVRPSLSRRTTASRASTSSKGPPALPTRTPVRTKRRSVSSTLSESDSPSGSKRSTAPQPPQNFSSLLGTPAPLIFSTPLERELLTSLSVLGFDTGQIVHSVLAYACDATGALWWMLKRKAERRTLQEATSKIRSESRVSVGREGAHHSEEEKPKTRSFSNGKEERSRSPIPQALVQAHSAPELQFIPATPTASMHRPATPPRAMSPSNPLLSPGNNTPVESMKSHPSTPSGSVKEKDGSKGRKMRSGSVSIMQRAATALEAAGLVRKKSNEAVKEENEKRVASQEDSRVSHGSHTGSGKLLKSPPLKPVKDEPSTPPRTLPLNPVPTTVGSPWVLAEPHHQSPQFTPANSPGNSLGTLSTIGENSVKLGNGQGRNRASLLSAFRTWFKEDAKGKRKEPPPALVSQSLAYPQNPGSPSPGPSTGRGRGTVKRRMSNGNTRPKVTPGRKTGNRAKRGSVSSRRSSSVNSKRSSATSMQIGGFEPSSYGEQMASISRQRSDPSRQSFGAHTPNSESRPSSVHSFTAQQPRHRKSPSASSAGSLYNVGRTSSPLPSKIHRRHGSGSSTRVVRQLPLGASYKQPHLRSNSASSNHSLSSSRHGSLYELSEAEEVAKDSPARYFARGADDTPRRGGHSPTTFVAQKRTTPFSNPGGGSNAHLHSIGRSSWKKSWGMEPPGWQTRTAKASTIEVLAVFPSPAGGIRDVFTGRQSFSMGDESDWVDEDDDVSGYVGGLGQMPVSSPTVFGQPDSPIIAPPVSHVSRGPNTNRTGSRSTVSPIPGRNSRRTTGRSPAGRTSPAPGETSFDLPPEIRGGRRGQLPNTQPAFRQTIQEEDEDEEE